MKARELTYATRKVLGFLVAKGLLRSKTFQPNANVKLRVDDFLRAAEEVEPRVLEVLPAAILRFPKAFLDRGRLPDPLPEIIDSIKEGREDGPALFHVPFSELKRWADAKLKDKRSKPLCERKRNKTYRLSPEVVRKIESQAALEGRSETQLIEELVNKHL